MKKLVARQVSRFIKRKNKSNVPGVIDRVHYVYLNTEVESRSIQAC
jgi:hypothetical protein